MSIVRISACVALIAACAACEDVVPPEALRELGSITLSTPQVRLLPSDTVRLTVDARDTGGNPVAVAAIALIWTSLDTGLAVVTNGLVRARPLAEGVAEDTTWVRVQGTGSRGSPRADSARIVVARAARPQDALRMGMNLTMVNDWSTEWPFVDVFRSSRYWISQREGAGWGQGGPLATDANHWITSLQPGQYATTIMLNDVSGHQPGGDYVLLYDGNGEIRFEHNANVSVVVQEPGRMVVRVVPSTAGVFLSIRRTDPSDPIRNIRFIRPGMESTARVSQFTADFLRVIRPFGTLRFMQWQWTNDRPISQWANRGTRQFATFSGPWGVPQEVMVELANEIGADPWFCMPHDATDDYVRQFATLVRDQLQPRQRVYVEYSNEVWNGIFPQTAYVRQRGQALGLSGDVFQASLRFYSQRAVEIFAIWREVFGADSARVARVLASQASNSWVSEQVLSWRDAHRSTDALAIAPYFGGYLSGGDGSRVAAMSESQVLDALSADIEGPVRGWIEANARVAQSYGVRLIAYEGGQHLETSALPSSTEPIVTRLFHAVNRHPRMGDLYRRYFELWYQAGGDLFVAYEDASAWSRFGAWGALEYIHQDPATSPKYTALLEAAVRFSR